MKVGDLVREITRMNRRPELGIVMEINHHRPPMGEIYFPYFVWFFDGDFDWMREEFLVVVNESR